MKINDIVKLDDNNEYVIVSKINYENINYYYLADINNFNNVLFLYENKDELKEVSNIELLKKIMPLLYKEAREYLTSCKDNDII